MHPGRQMVHKMRQGTMNGLGSDEMIIIKHEHEILFLPVKEVVDEPGQHDCWFRWLGKAEQCVSARAQVGSKRLQGSNNGGEKLGGFIVLRLKRQPWHGRSRGGSPFVMQGPFAR